MNQCCKGASLIYDAFSHDFDIVSRPGAWRFIAEPEGEATNLD